MVTNLRLGLFKITFHCSIRAGEGITVETWILPAFVDLTCICGFTFSIKAMLPIRKLPQSEGESLDSAFLESTLKKLLNLATEIEKLRKALIGRQLNVNIRFLEILKNAFYTYKFI